MKEKVLDLILKNQLSEASKILDNNNHFNPKNPETLWLRSKIHNKNKDYEKAIKSIRDISEIRTLTANELNDLAINLRLSGQTLKALEHFRNLKKSGFSDYSIHHNIANCLFDNGDLENAIEHYKKAIKKNPNYAPAHENLNMLLWELNKNDELFSSYQQQLQIEPKNYELLSSYLNLLIRAGRNEDAQQVLDSQDSLLLSLPEFISIKANLLKQQGLTHEARQTIEKQFQHVTFNKNQILAYIELLILDKDIDLAFQFLNGMLNTHPNDQSILALLTYVNAIANSNSSLALNNYKELIQTYDINDYLQAAEKDFYHELIKQLDALHKNTRAPLTQSLRGGSQTKGNLFAHDSHEISILKDFFKQSISSYHDHSRDLPEPYAGFSQTCDDYRFSGSWSVRLKSGGHHHSHMHPMGWLSSVFYVDLPSVTENSDTQEGWLHFGVPNFVPFEQKLTQMNIQPKPGLLVIFPSYFWHGTYAFNDKSNDRLTIAFDAIKDWR